MVFTHLKKTVRQLGLTVVLPVTLLVGAIAYFATPYVDVTLQRWMTTDISSRARLIARIVENSINTTDLNGMGVSGIAPILTVIANDERVYALAICGSEIANRTMTKLWPEGLGCDAALPSDSVNRFELVNVNERSMHLERVPLTHGNPNLQRGLSLLLLHDLTYGSLRAREGKLYAGILLILIWGSVIATLYALVQFNFFTWQRTLRKALTLDVSHTQRADWLSREGMRGLSEQIDEYSRDLERQSRLLLAQSVVWNRDAIQGLQKEHFAQDEVIVISNRQPYSHVNTDRGIEVTAPASGLVTALEPVVQSCGGLWIAHGSGDADRTVVDQNDTVQVPPAQPCYQLRRVWLTEEELIGYYNGFSNQGLWPLCLLAHVRPRFDDRDWEVYKSVNQKFADAAVASAKSDNPVILVQDYHMALVPEMIRKKLPMATIITFWHIPWPNAETFSICPWAPELLKGLLGSSIVGFHTSSFCSNFLSCVDSFLEARIDRDKGRINYQQQQTAVNSYPISIDWDEANKYVHDTTSTALKTQLLDQLNLPTQSIVLLGVDRMDYSKGLLERLLAFEKLLDDYPERVGRVFLVQIASPTRTQLSEYEVFSARVVEEVQRINEKFRKPMKADPIVLRHRHHSHQEVQRYLKAADVCLVTSLHDGMNLVAKEYIAVKDDNSGALVLSQFAGACDELPEAAIVNPYDTASVAQTIDQLISADGRLLRERMASMRRTVATKNIYAWAGEMLLDAWSIRQQDRLRQKR